MTCWWRRGGRWISQLQNLMPDATCQPNCWEKNWVHPGHTELLVLSPARYTPRAQLLHRTATQNNPPTAAKQHDGSAHGTSSAQLVRSHPNSQSWGGAASPWARSPAAWPAQGQSSSAAWPAQGCSPSWCGQLRGALPQMPASPVLAASAASDLAIRRCPPVHG